MLLVLLMNGHFQTCSLINGNIWVGPLMNGNIWKCCWVWYSVTSAWFLKGSNCYRRSGKCQLESGAGQAFQDGKQNSRLQTKICPPRSLFRGTWMVPILAWKHCETLSLQPNPTLAFGNKGNPMREPLWHRDCPRGKCCLKCTQLKQIGRNWGGG